MTDTSQHSFDEPDDVRIVEEFTISNEFANVIVRKVVTRNGERLQIFSPFFRSSATIDALQVEGLTWQTPEFFSHALRGSTGPTPDDGESLPVTPPPTNT